MSRRVECEVTETKLDGDHGAVDGVTAECSACGHGTESFGTSDASVRRCLVRMRDECPIGEDNYYAQDM